MSRGENGSAASARVDKSIVGEWWWSVDRWTLSAILFLSLAGIVLVSAASPAVAERIGLSPFYFVYRHILFLIPTILLMLGVSMLGRRTIWRTGAITLGVSMALMLCAVFFGPEIKGATRWVHFLGMSVQPSEFAKPCFAIVSAWFMSRKNEGQALPGYVLSTGLFATVIGFLMMQPDLGMSLVMSSIWGVQIFLAGLPMLLVFAVAGLGAFGIFTAYMFFPHVTSRIDRFLDPSSGDNYQVQKSLDAFSNGGFFGVGPGHGQVKLNLPDAHADFIFAVAGEEMGLLAALLLVSVFIFILVRSVYRVSKTDDLFVLLGAGGLLTQFAFQSLIHMGSSLQLLPAKGMTLPFISYGGSSMLSLGLGMGMLLSLTRKRLHASVGSVSVRYTRARQGA
jgi:cell division protein FtsW